MIYAPVHYPIVHFIGRSRITCYLPTGNRTFTGTIPNIGTIAVDPKIIPLGADVMVTGIDIIFHAEDTGRLVKGNHVDIFVFNMAQAYKYQGKGYANVVWWIP